MHGMGVYFARADKALSFAKRRAQPLAGVQGGITQGDLQQLKTLCATAEVQYMEVWGRGSWGRDAASPLGVVLLCDVALGRCKVQPPSRDVAYPSLRDTVYTDHTGRWYAWEGYDSVHLLDGSAPVARLAEWCVSDPMRARVTHCVVTANCTTAADIMNALGV
jgi:hypothetical protein